MNYLKKVFTYITIFSTVLWSIGIPLFPFTIDVPKALAAAGDVTNVTLTDVDTTGIGLDGRDFKVTWVPDPNTPNGPAGYMGTRIFIVPNSISIPNAAAIATACSGNGGMCMDKGFFPQYQQNMHTLPQFETKDSNNGTFSATAYKACVLIDATTDSIACSSSVTPTSESSGSITDTTRPFVNHLSLFAAPVSTNATVHALVRDDVTTASEFAAGTGGAQVQLYYGTDVSVTQATSTVAQLSGDLFAFTIPSASIPVLNNTFEYYISAKDKSNNQTFFCANPSALTQSDCQTMPFVTKTITAGTLTISGTITKSGATPTALDGARVFVGGYPVVSATTNGSGAYTLSNIPSFTSLDIIAYKSGFCENRYFANTASSNLTNINFSLNEGNCGFTGTPPGGGTPPPGGTSGGSPMVVFSGPPDNSSFVSLSEKIRVGFNMELTASTVNDADSTDSGSNVYLTTDGTTKVAGTVTYCPSVSSPGCSSLFPMDQNTILFTPTASLTANTFYTLVIGSGVTSTSGQSVMGNKPGGGHEIHFSTGSTTVTNTQMQQSFGTGGMFMPPFVQSMVPAPGMSASTNTKPLVTFSEPMDTTSLTTTNIKLVKRSDNSNVTITVSVDSTNKVVTITPSANLTGGDYEVRVLGAAKNAQGVTMRGFGQETEIAFSGSFTVSGTADTTAPTIFPLTQNNATNVPVNIGFLEYGFSEQLSPSTVTTNNITMARGSSSVSITVRYDPGRNSVFVIPDNILANTTSYTVSFGTGITDLAGVVLASATSYSFTTGAADQTAPKLVDGRCDDYRCRIKFNEPMNGKTRTDATNYASSVLNPANFTLVQGTSLVSNDAAGDLVNASSTSLTYSYDGVDFAVEIAGFSATLTAGQNFTVRVESTTKDLAGNAIAASTFTGKIEDSKITFGNFGGDMGMFGPPKDFFGGMTGGAPVGGFTGGEFKPEGFGNFSAEQFHFGQADMAFAFNNMASQDVNVFQVRFTPGVVVANNYTVDITFPNGTGLSNVSQDQFSPFKSDFNQFAPGTITFGTLDTDGISVDASTRTVTVQLAVTGTPGANDPITIDLRKITNPAVPKGPESGGYTVTIKLKDASGNVLATKTSTPYYIMEGGTRSITLKVFAGASGGTVGADGAVFVFGGGPSGPLDTQMTLDEGVISASDSGTVTGTGTDKGVQFSSLPDGCYFFGTEPLITLGGNDYFGQMAPEPICVDAANTSKTKTIILQSAAATGASVAVTVKITGTSNFSGADIDIFAGGQGNFVVKKLSGVNAPESNGYTVRLNSNGNWFIGMGPGMAKGPSSGMPTPLPCTPPPPVDINISGLPGTATMSAGFRTPPGVTIDATTKTITMNCATSDKQVAGTVTDGVATGTYPNGTPLGDIEVFVHSEGFGAPTFTRTKSDGTFTLNIANFGSYELGTFKQGLPPKFDSLDVRPDGDDAGTAIDIFYKGKQITGSNPLIVKLKKPAYTISGKILDTNNNGVSYAPVFGTNSATGEFTGGGSGSDGSYTLFVDPGTYVIKAEMPPDKTDSCATYSKTVTVTNANQSNQNLTPTASTCYTLSGTVTVAGSTLPNAPVFIEAWDTTNDRPAGGFFRPTNTDSNGVYTAKVAPNTGSEKYRIGTWDKTFGELSVLQQITNANVTNANIASGTTGTITFAFTGGTADAEAFIELKLATDKHTRLSKMQKGLTSNVTFTAKEGTYNYFVNVKGVGNFTGTVATGGTATIDLSTSTLVTISGNVDDATGTNLKGALVAVKETTTGNVRTTTTDASGDYSIQVKAGTYQVTPSLSGFVPGAAAPTVTAASGTATQNFTGASALTKSDRVISGTVYKSDGSTKVTEGFVFAENSAGITVSAPVEASTGTYTLPVTDGAWTVKAVAPLHAKKTLGTLTVAGADITTVNASTTNITLTTADNTRSSKSTSSSLAATTGGTINDTGNTDVKMIAGAGVLQATAGNVTVEMEKTFTAPETANLKPLGDAAFDISATGSSTIKELTGNVEIALDYTSMVSQLPTGVTEADLKLAYYSQETGSYVPVEGGFTVDAANNTITGQVNHFTTFVIVYAPTTSSTSTPTSSITAPAAGGFVSPSASQQPQPKVDTKKTPSKELAQAPQQMIEKKAASRGDQIQRIVNEAKKLLSGKVTDLLALVGAKRDIAKEQKVDKGLAAKVIGKLKVSLEARRSLTNFITYGTPETIKLGDGERAGVADSFRDAFGRVPASEKDWGNVLKIAVGRWPDERSERKEKQAEETFKLVYGHSPNRKDPKEDAAVTIMAYGLRPGTRSTTNEKAAILSYRVTFKSDPKDAKAWNTVRAIAYSGAKKAPAQKTVAKVAGERIELPSAVFDRNLSPGDSGADVGRLQQLLASDSEIYGEGTVNGSYGALTKEAVGKFQLKYGVVNSRGDPGYGYVGTRTREKLQELFGR